MDRGWIKSYRKLIESEVFKNPELLQLWIYCLHRANSRPQWVPIKTGRGTTQVKVEKGQFIFGSRQVAEDLKQSKSSIHRRLVLLEKMQNVGRQVEQHYTVVTICNWESYQPYTISSGTPSGTASGQHRDKTIREEKEKKKKERPKATAEFELFWEKFPNKKKKVEAQRVFERLVKSGTPAQVIIDGIKGNARLEREEKRFRPYPTTWLNDGGWMDEPDSRNASINDGCIE